MIKRVLKGKKKDTEKVVNRINDHYVNSMLHIKRSFGEKYEDDFQVHLATIAKTIYCLFTFIRLYVVLYHRFVISMHHNIFKFTTITLSCL